MSTGDPAEPDLTLGIVGIGINQNERLPGPQQQPAGLDGNRHAGTHQCRHHMIGTMSGRPVLMPPSIVSRKNFIESVEEVGIATGSGFQDGQTGRGMGHKHRQQSVPSPVDELGGI